MNQKNFFDWIDYNKTKKYFITKTLNFDAQNKKEREKKQ